jgi:hypothetical protein
VRLVFRRQQASTDHVVSVVYYKCRPTLNRALAVRSKIGHWPEQWLDFAHNLEPLVEIFVGGLANDRHFALAQSR